MIASAKLKAATPSEFERQFIAPLSLEECQRRLSWRTEPTRRWAGNWQTRIQVDTWPISRDSLGFRVYRVPRWMWARYDKRLQETRAYGQLFRQADATTLVQTRAATTILGYFGYFWYSIFFASCLTFILLHPRQILDVSVLKTAIFITFLFLPIAYWCLQRDQRALLQIVEAELKGNHFER